MPHVTERPRALRFRTGEVRRVIHRTGTAMEVIGPLEPGTRVTGLTAGQFSAIDAMEHMVDELGPADVRISTWTTGLYDARREREIRVAGRIRSVRMLLDRGTFEKSPKFAGPLIEALGVDAFRCLSVHAKVVIVSGARGAAVMRSSMNLTHRAVRHRRLRDGRGVLHRLVRRALGGERAEPRQSGDPHGGLQSLRRYAGRRAQPAPGRVRPRKTRTESSWRYPD